MKRKPTKPQEAFVQYLPFVGPREEEPLSQDMKLGAANNTIVERRLICPRCKRPEYVLKSVRPGEHDGKTHYCTACQEDGDCFYFLPQ